MSLKITHTTDGESWVRKMNALKVVGDLVNLCRKPNETLP